MNLEKIVLPSFVNEYVIIGEGSRIWRFCNIYGTKENPVKIGDNTQIGTGCEIKPNVFIGNNCRIQYGVFIPEQVKIEDYVFIGPRAAFTNDKYPDIVKTLNKTWIPKITNIKSYVTIGAGAIILPNITVEEYAQIGAGAIVTKKVNAFSIVQGNPAKKVGDIREDKFKEIYKEILVIHRESKKVIK